MPAKIGKKEKQMLLDRALERAEQCAHQAQRHSGNVAVLYRKAETMFRKLANREASDDWEELIAASGAADDVAGMASREHLREIRARRRV